MISVKFHINTVQAYRTDNEALPSYWRLEISVSTSARPFVYATDVHTDTEKQHAQANNLCALACAHRETHRINNTMIPCAQARAFGHACACLRFPFKYVYIRCANEKRTSSVCCASGSDRNIQYTYVHMGSKERECSAASICSLFKAGCFAKMCNFAHGVFACKVHIQL